MNTSAGVKPGEVVVITGGQHTLPLMEAVAAEVARAGGQANMLLTTNKVAHAELLDTPEVAIQADNAIADATVEVDGKVLVRQGQLVSPVMASAAPLKKNRQ